MRRQSLPFPVEPPHLARHYRRILDDLTQGRDVLWLFPRGTDVAAHVSNLVRLGSNWLTSRMLASDEWSWGNSASDGRKGLTVSVQLRLAVGGEHSGAQPDIFVLSPLRLGTVRSGRRNGVGECRVTIEVLPPPRERRPLLIPVLAEEIPAPVTGRVDLSVRPFWGCISTMHMQQMAHTWLGEGVDPSYALWASTVWVELAGFDSGMLFELIERRVRPAEWQDFLQEYGSRSQWTRADFLARHAPALHHPALWQASVSPQYEDAPPFSLFELWAEGACDRVADRGVELHSALVAALGWNDLLVHRIWRGQAGALLPVIDQARLALARCLDVPLKNDGGPVEFTDLQTAAAAAGQRNSGDLKTVVAQLHRARNHLAHYQCLTWDWFQSVVAALLRLPRLVPHAGWTQPRSVVP